ncbi:hypothetical protein AGABI1DRAFT_104928 [Agaricus bisporus var. burnettii JB137-S8]|uniref:Fungal-type protein kinase domain-containing protein n=1 Tax=Agaricus bisporus var. burnettii (strain JB137-S8 / ATCC MYA-4627 / FGSC 10392) TaxID=597362 RepID=K5W8M6_AGABU|nr:uncharacterized protein AGABI1DRAFT_104928 [Agaricus bisporus var. burnettii JB137-S8]EKM83214.1 hypothetical protein AGABI1DRAFT_104928 [Agaricus bisporus var. burnettii JB137-S8]
MRAQLDRATFLDAYFAYPESSQQLQALSSPLQSTQYRLIPESSPPQPSTPWSTQFHPSHSQSFKLQSPPPQLLPIRSQFVDHTTALPLPQHILNHFIQDRKYRENAWVGLPKDQDSKMMGEDAYKFLLEVFTRIASLTAEYYRNNEKIPGKWMDTNKISLRSWSKNRVLEDPRPDFIFAHDETVADQVCWSRVFAMLEIKNQRVESEVTGAQFRTYVSHIFAEQVDRLFVYALKMEGCELQVYRFDRSGVVCMQDKINIHESPEDFIRVIASFSYLSPADLGWDSTCTVWDSATNSPQASYKLSQNAFRECGVYDIPWVLEVANERFVAIGAVNPKRGLSILGRATFIVRAVTLADWKNKHANAKVYILKQYWQRLPRVQSDPKIIELRNSDKQTPDQSDRDGVAQQIGLEVDKKPFEETVMERARWMDRLKKSWIVEMNGKPVTTFDTIRKNHATEASPGPEVTPGTLGTNDMEFTGSSSATTPATLDTLQNDLAHSVLVSRSLVRLVFDRPGWPIERFTSKRELLLAVRMIVEELGSLYKKGIIHRDVSPGNLILSDSGGHIIDFDHSKITFETRKATVQRKESEDVLEVASAILENTAPAENYVGYLKILWNVKDRPATPTDFRWPTEYKPVYSFSNRSKRNGFFTGTYEYLSHHLKRAKFHHCTHDLDSLFWNMNKLPLKFEGPGGKKRQNPPVDIIKTYYDDGPDGKHDMASSFFTDRQEWGAMMASYSDYFKDLIPMMEKWYQFVYIACRFEGFEYHQPHEILVKIIDEAIEGLGPEAEKGYEDDAEEEKRKRQKEKDDMEKAISKQMTVATLLKEMKVGSILLTSATTPTESVPAVCNQPLVKASPGPSTPLVNRIPAARSPETDRVVKRLRANPPRLEST